MEGPATMDEDNGNTVTAVDEYEESGEGPLWYSVGWVALIGVLGCLARILTDQLFNLLLGVYGDGINEQQLAASTLSNIVGSFILGLLEAVHENDPLPRVAFAALTTGFCGAYTTFSGWEVQETLLFSDGANLFNAWCSSFISLLQGMCLFLIAHVLGLDTGNSVMRALGLSHVRKIIEKRGRSRCAPVSVRALVLESCAASMLVLLPVLLLAFDSRSQFRRESYAALLFAPFGVLARFALAKLFNDRWLNGKFRFGTWLANITGTAALALLVRHTNPATYWAAVASNGLEVGFISSFTTMSTFVGELVKLREKFGPSTGITYALMTLIAAQLLAGFIGPWSD